MAASKNRMQCHYLSLGYGMHCCLGARVTELQVATVIEKVALRGDRAITIVLYQGVP